MEKKLDGNYTRMLYTILNKSGKQHPHKTVAVQLLTSPLKNHPSKTYKALLEKKGQTHKQYSSMNPYTWAIQCWPTSKDFHQLCMDTGSSLDDQSGVMDDRHMESLGNLSCQCDSMMISGELYSS